jgi:hypothetical protein
LKLPPPLPIISAAAVGVSAAAVDTVHMPAVFCIAVSCIRSSQLNLYLIQSDKNKRKAAFNAIN